MILPEELSVEVALEFGLEFSLDSKASLDQPSESSPDSNVLRELLNRLRPPFKCTLIVGSFRRTLLLVCISLSFVTIFVSLFEFMGLDEFIPILILSFLPFISEWLAGEFDEFDDIDTESLHTGTSVTWQEGFTLTLE